jgi:hypothetical protein
MLNAKSKAPHSLGRLFGDLHLHPAACMDGDCQGAGMPVIAGSGRLTDQSMMW